MTKMRFFKKNLIFWIAAINALFQTNIRIRFIDTKKYHIAKSNRHLFSSY